MKPMSSPNLSISTVTKVHTAVRITLAIAMISALGTGIAFAGMLIGKVIESNPAPVSSSVALVSDGVAPEPTADLVAADRILIKRKTDITEQQAAVLDATITAPYDVMRSADANTLIPRHYEDAQLPNPSASSTSQLDTATTEITREIVRVGISQQGVVLGNIADPVELAELFPDRAMRSSALHDVDLESWEVIQFDAATDPSQMLTELAANPGIAAVQVDGVVNLHASTTPPLQQKPDVNIEKPLEVNDYYYTTDLGTPPIYSWGQTYPDQYGLKHGNFEDAWRTTLGAESVIIAVIDSGIDGAHPDLAGKLWENDGEIVGNGIDDDGNGYIDDRYGWDFYGSATGDTSEDNDPADDYGHGTHVAGIIGARTNNEIGIAGVCGNCQIMNVKAFHNGSSYDSYVAQAIIYAVDNGADVINMSFGTYGRRPILNDAIQYAYASGVVLVASSGNNGGDFTKISPAGLNQTISVGALTPDDEFASFSNWGYGLDVAAPGVDVLSLRASGTDMYGDGAHIVDGDYYRANGTSFAAPFISGLVGLMFSLDPQMPIEEVRQSIVSTATDLVRDPGPGCELLDVTQCQSNYYCHLDYSGSEPACVETACPTLAGDSCGSGDSLVCTWDTFAERCHYWSYYYEDYPEPYGVGHDPYTGYGLVSGGDALSAYTPVYGRLVSPAPAQRVLTPTTLEIRGSAAGLAFDSYRIQYRERGANQPWTTLFSSTSPVSNPYGTLAAWEVSALDGWYELRLEIIPTSGAASVQTQDVRFLDARRIDDVAVASGQLPGNKYDSLIAYDDIVGLVYGDNYNEVRFIRSIDGGQTFAEPVTVGTGNFSGWAFRFPSMIARSPQTGTLFISWSEFDQFDDGQYHHKIYLLRSTDDGDTFGDPITVIDHIYPTDSIWEQPVVSVSDTGMVYIASQDGRPLYSGGAGVALYFVASSDDGLTFGDEIQVVDNFAATLGESFSIDAHGDRLHLLYTGSSDYTAHYRAWDSNAGLGDEVAFVSGIPQSSSFTYFPRVLALDQQTVIAAWSESWIANDASYAADVFVARSVDGGLTFGPPSSIIPTGVPYHEYFPYIPFLTALPDNDLALLWIKHRPRFNQYPSLQTDVMLSISNDQGETFDEAVAVSDIGHNQSIIVTGDTTTALLHVAWTEYTAENLYTIYYDQVDL